MKEKRERWREGGKERQRQEEKEGKRECVYVWRIC